MRSISASPWSQSRSVVSARVTASAGKLLRAFGLALRSQDPCRAAAPRDLRYEVGGRSRLLADLGEGERLAITALVVQRARQERGCRGQEGPVAHLLESFVAGPEALLGRPRLVPEHLDERRPLGDGVDREPDLGEDRVALAHQRPCAPELPGHRVQPGQCAEDLGLGLAAAVQLGAELLAAPDPLWHRCGTEERA